MLSLSQEKARKRKKLSIIDRPRSQTHHCHTLKDLAWSPLVTNNYLLTDQRSVTAALNLLLNIF